ncbi:MAG: Uncharacterised protein [SAR116 cluster bacterium]|nr:MAG: Uncharacterised protein [SAR116 cluster bacterium]
MPGCGFCGAGFLDKHMIMKQLHRLRRHQIGCHCGNFGLADHLFKRRNSLPVAIIIKKSSRFTRAQIFCCIGTGTVHIHCDPGRNILYMIGKQPFDQHRAISLIGMNVLLRN